MSDERDEERPEAAEPVAPERPDDDAERQADGDPGDEAEEGGGPAKPVRRVWDRPDDKNDPPSGRPEDTHEEDRRRKAG